MPAAGCPNHLTPGSQHIEVNSLLYDWSQSFLKLSPSEQAAVPKWLNTQKQNESSHPEWVRFIDGVNETTLNNEQQQCLALIREYLNKPQASGNSSNNNIKEPLRLIISGTAGTGKSYLIRAIYGLLGTRCRLTATTGVAALNIAGTTLHSLLKLYVQKQSKGFFK